MDYGARVDRWPMYDNDRLYRVRPVLESTLRGWPPTRQRLRLAADTTAPGRARDFLGAVCAEWETSGFDFVRGEVAAAALPVTAHAATRTIASDLMRVLKCMTVPFFRVPLAAA